MKIDAGTIRHVAEIARLRLTKNEVEEITPQLEEVLQAFSKISDVDTGSLEPSFQPVPIADRLREDAGEGCLSQEEALSNSKKTKDGYFKGPRAV